MGREVCAELACWGWGRGAWLAVGNLSALLFPPWLPAQLIFLGMLKRRDTELRAPSLSPALLSLGQPKGDTPLPCPNSFRDSSISIEFQRQELGMAIEPQGLTMPRADRGRDHERKATKCILGKSPGGLRKEWGGRWRGTGTLGDTDSQDPRSWDWS